MRVHCLGGKSPLLCAGRIPGRVQLLNSLLLSLRPAVGSIGSLIATNLASLPNNPPQVRLILRKKALAAALTADPNSRPSSFPPAVSPGPHVSLTIERDGLARRTDGFEVEMTPTAQDAMDRGRTLAESSGMKGSAGAYRSKKHGDLIRNDPISTLIITTKSPQTIPAIRPLLPRLSSRSTIVLCQNGMGVLEGLLSRYWPDDVEGSPGLYGAGGRPSFICATTTHGAWRKGSNHFVHAGVGDLKFGVVPNSAVISALSNLPVPNPWAGGDANSNPLINPQSLEQPLLAHLPLTPATVSLHETVAALLAAPGLRARWLPLPTLQVAQLQKLAVNAAVNGLTAILGVHNGALVGSRKARALVWSIMGECAAVFAAHIAREEGRWTPPIALSEQTSDDQDDEDSRLARHVPSTVIPRDESASPPPPTLPESHPLSASSLADYTLRVLFQTSTNLSSTVQDLLATDPATSFGPSHAASRTEVDFIHGYIVALATRYGLQVPVIDSIGRLVLLKEEMLRVGAVDRLVEARSVRSTLAPSATSARSRGRAQSIDSSRTGTQSQARVFTNRRRTGSDRPSSADGGELNKAHARAAKQRALRESRAERDHRIAQDRIRRSSQ